MLLREPVVTEVVNIDMEKLPVEETASLDEDFPSFARQAPSRRMSAERRRRLYRKRRLNRRSEFRAGRMPRRVNGGDGVGAG